MLLISSLVWHFGVFFQAGKYSHVEAPSGLSLIQRAQRLHIQFIKLETEDVAVLLDSFRLNRLGDDHDILLNQESQQYLGRGSLVFLSHQTHDRVAEKVWKFLFSS